MTENKAQPEPHETPSVASSSAAQTRLGRALNFVGGRNVTWLLASASALSSMTFFFSIDKALIAFGATVASFVTLPMGVMARSFVTRNLPQGPVASALAGASFGAAYGLAAGAAAIKEGEAVSYLACVAFLILGASVGFVLLGGIANVVVSRRRA
jgi:hypothetical protein